MVGRKWMRAKESLPRFDSERNEGVFIDNSIIVASLVMSDWTWGTERKERLKKKRGGKRDGDEKQDEETSEEEERKTTLIKIRGMSTRRDGSRMKSRSMTW